MWDHRGGCEGGLWLHVEGRRWLWENQQGQDEATD